MYLCTVYMYLSTECILYIPSDSNHHNLSICILCDGMVPIYVAYVYLMYLSIGNWRRDRQIVFKLN